MRSIKCLLELLVMLYPVLGAAWQSADAKKESQVTRIEQKAARVDIDDDDSYSPHLKRPAFEQNGPVVLLDEAHGNSHFDKGFARLIAADGFQVVTSRSELTFEGLSKARILVIMNTGVFMPWQWRENPWPLFNDRESAAVQDWVAAGGALLFAAASSKREAGDMLLSRLGIELQEGHIVDPPLTKTASQPSTPQRGTTFSREKGTLAGHNILAGRSDVERVNTLTFNAVTAIRKAPGNVTSLVHYSERALLLPRDVFLEKRLTEEAKELHANGKNETPVSISPLTTASPAPAAPVAVAFTFGKGRVVVIGNSSAMSSVVVRRVQPEGAPSSEKVGLGEADNEKFTINVMHWLAGLLD
jgi:hypothetical protein